MAKMKLQAQVNGDRVSAQDPTAFPGRGLSPGDYRSTATAGSPASAKDGNLFIIDTEGSHEHVETGLPMPKLKRSPSLCPSDSSEEVIVFSGRNRSPMVLGEKHISFAQESNTFGMRPIQRAYKPETMSPSESTFSSSAIPSSDCQPNSPIVETYAATRRGQIASAVNGAQRKSSQHSCHRPKRESASTKRQLEEELLADYIANIDDGDDLRSFITNPRLKGCDERDAISGEWQDETAESATERQVDAMLEGAVGWSATDLQDLDEVSASDELLEAIEHIISKRERASGIQYLVVWKGCTVDDARWIPLTSLKMPGADEKIRLFEVKEKLVERYLLSYDTSNESFDDEEQLAMDLDGDLEDFRDNKDLLERQKARLTDEQIARLLSKQEELGFGSDELMLFDGLEGKQEDGQDIPEALRAGTTLSNLRVRARKKKQPLRGFPSATAFADVLDQDPYNGFDIMDHERPSLRKRSKGRRGVLPFELSDSDLEVSIRSAWEKDRSRKKTRKQEREELRKQGLLGRKGKLDMKAKYAEGISLDEIKGEIRDFLITPSETLSLPAMDKHARKMVHEIANVFNLKSKSVGGGRSRFPELYKTSRTTLYSEDALSLIESRLNQRRFLPRMDQARQRGAAPRGGARRGGRGGGFAGAAVSYRDGEVVGAAAPEIGAENKGRAMLEKMGWSTGTALGALNNKGIMQPVVHVVKTTKAGLG
ncbi:Single-stranded nucleic acid binding R3H [Lasallia pustulata]|uniref:Protein SQS1 n=1 Tax=Lasallia pustulata TaxID=136370 RepID=A0A1W5D235_9LECA|nr:Single-stranded nucleic acid binding R3H [Lasallia pustulata]